MNTCHPSAADPDELVEQAVLIDEAVDHFDRTNFAKLKAGTPFPPLVLGTAPFGYGSYNSKASLSYETCYRLVRLALRSGITAFDTAPFYHPSEIILGKILRTLQHDFPRSSYQLMTKAGKYGGSYDAHDYSPQTIRASVERSLKRLGTDYLDVVYLHDVEFISTLKCPAGDPSDLFRDHSTPPLGPDASPFLPAGDGDRLVLQAVEVLRDLQKQGKVKLVGLCGYPLPILLRLALLTLKSTGQPIDVVQTYAHQTLMNSSLSDHYLKAFTHLAKVQHVTNASPLAMGFLTTPGRQPWHSSQIPIESARLAALPLCERRNMSIEQVACHFGYRPLYQDDGNLVPVVLGCKSLDELQGTLAAFLKARDCCDAELDEVVEEIRASFAASGVLGYSWQSPA